MSSINMNPNTGGQMEVINFCSRVKPAAEFHSIASIISF
jgi:hypothetical protein